MKKLLATLAILATLYIPNAFSTLSSTTMRTVTANGNGVTTNYTIGFTFQDNDQLRVYSVNSGTGVSTLLLEGAGLTKYTITGGDPGTTVVMGTAPTSSEFLVILRSSARTQVVNYDENSAFPAEDHEEQLDKLTQVVQEMDFDLGRASRQSPYDTSTVADGDILRYDGDLARWGIYDIDSALLGASSGDLATPITVSNGGTGLSTLTANNIVLGNGSNDVLFVAPGTSGNILQSTGTTWESTAALATPITVSNGGTGLATLTSQNLIVGNDTGNVSFVAPGAIGTFLYSSGSTWAASTMMVLSSTSAERIVRARIAAPSGGACAVTAESGNWVEGTPQSSGTGICTITFVSHTFSAVPACTFMVEEGSDKCATFASPAATGITVNVFQCSTGNMQDDNFHLICMGPR